MNDISKEPEAPSNNLSSLKNTPITEKESAPSAPSKKKNRRGNRNKNRPETTKNAEVVRGGKPNLLPTIQ